jgi:hypothetical protein
MNCPTRVGKCESGGCSTVPVVCRKPGLKTPMAEKDYGSSIVQVPCLKTLLFEEPDLKTPMVEEDGDCCGVQVPQAEDPP